MNSTLLLASTWEIISQIHRLNGPESWRSVPRQPSLQVQVYTCNGDSFRRRCCVHLGMPLVDRVNYTPFTRLQFFQRGFIHDLPLAVHLQVVGDHPGQHRPGDVA